MSADDAPEFTAEEWDAMRSIARRIKKKQFDAFREQGIGCGWCRHPIRVRGIVTVDDGVQRKVAFSTASLPDGITLKACGSRRETRCPSCATVYRGDVRHLVRAGLTGGKGIDEAVAGNPAVLVTFTAPSFGTVHARKITGTCHPGSLKDRCEHGRPRSCPGRHEANDDIVGAPLCPDCYDFEGAVLHNACTPELWRRTTIYLLRQLAAVVGRTQADTRGLVRLSSCRVAEYQRRGLVHLHAVIRADGADGGPPLVSALELAQAVVLAAQAVSVTNPLGLARWGEQIDVQVLDRSDEERARKVSSYVAKYATKSSEGSGVLDARIISAEDLAHRRLSPHLRRMAEVSWELGGDPKFRDFNLRRHTHSLGYGGHFLSKSRGYSTTLGALRDARQAWMADRKKSSTGLDQQIAHASRWTAVGIGWANRGEATWAEWQREQRADELRCAAEDRYSPPPDEQ